MKTPAARSVCYVAAVSLLLLGMADWDRALSSRPPRGVSGATSTPCGLWMYAGVGIFFHVARKAVRLVETVWGRHAERLPTEFPSAKESEG